MSVVKVHRTANVGGAVVYAVYGTYGAMKEGMVRAAAHSVSGGSLDTSPQQFISDTVAEIARHPRRQHQAILLIQSFHPDELDGNCSFDVQLAQLAGQELARRVAPNSDVMVVTHTDSKSGHVHNHIIITNHDRETGSVPYHARNFHAVQKCNDLAMRDLNLEVYESVPEVEKDLSYLRDTPLPEITTENWRDELKLRADALFMDSRVVSADDVKDGLEVAQDIAGEYGVSFRVTTHEKENRDDVTATSYALVDEVGDPIRYATSRGSRSTKRPGSRLGRGVYDLKSVSDRIGDFQEQYQQQQQQRILQERQIRQQRTFNILKGDENGTSQKEKDSGSTGQSLKERFKDVLADISDPSDSASDISDPSDSASDPSAAAGAALYGSGREGIAGDDGEGKGGRGQSSSGRGVSVSDSIREGGSRAGGDVKEVRESASARGGVGSQVEWSGTEARPAGHGESVSSGGSTADKSGKSTEDFGQAEWVPDESTKGLRQVDFDFLKERVMCDGHYQIRRSEFDGTDAEFFNHLKSDDEVASAECEKYVTPRIRVVNPVGDRRHYYLNTVGENLRAAELNRQRRLQRQKQSVMQSEGVDKDVDLPSY